MTRFLLRTLLLLVLIALFALPVGAQDGDGALVRGQPSIGFIPTAEARLEYMYTVSASSAVTLQAIGDAAPPALRVLQGDTVVAEAPNAAGAFILALTTYLPAGEYTIEVGTADGESGMMVLVVQAEAPLAPVGLLAGAAISGEVREDAPIGLYQLPPFNTPKWLTVSAPDGAALGANVQLRSADGSLFGMVAAGLTEVRFGLTADASGAALTVTFASGNTAPYVVCYSNPNESCGGGAIPVAVPTAAPTDATVATPEVSATLCLVTPNVAGGANVRQSADVGSILVGALPGNAQAEALAVSPNGQWFNIRYNNINGWVSRSVVNTSGPCDGLPTTNAPAPIYPPTLTPTPVPPTATPVPPTATSTPAGPCLLTVTAPVRVYQTPVVDPAEIYDQAQPGYELIPIGRLADNSWWQTNYASSWIQTSEIGVSVVQSGNCSMLPVVSP